MNLQKERYHNLQNKIDHIICCNADNFTNTDTDTDTNIEQKLLNCLEIAILRKTLTRCDVNEIKALYIDFTNSTNPDKSYIIDDNITSWLILPSSKIICVLETMLQKIFNN